MKTVDVARLIGELKDRCVTGEVVAEFEANKDNLESPAGLI